MSSPLLPSSLSRLTGTPVISMALAELEARICRGERGTVATNSSEVGRFCAYWVALEADVVHRVSSDFALRSRLKRLAKQHPTTRFLATGEVL